MIYRSTSFNNEILYLPLANRRNGNDSANTNRILSEKFWLILLSHLNFLDCFDPGRLLSNYVQIMLRLWLNFVDKPSGASKGSDYLELRYQDISDIKPTHFVNLNKCRTILRPEGVFSDD